MAEEEVDYTKLPLEERCLHKVWKARLSAYEELIKIFNRIDDERSPEWAKYLSLVKKFPVDSHAAAQEKALEATLIFMTNAHVAGKIVGDVLKGIISKCITATKVKSKELAAEIVLMCIEIEKLEIVQEELMNGTDQKNPKVVAGCVSYFNQIIKSFGHKVVTLKSLLKKVMPLTEDRDKTVREETKKLLVEIYRWIGEALRPQLSGIKPVMIQELEAEFSKAGEEKPQQTRYLRSQQAKKEAAAAEGSDKEDGEADGAEDAGGAEVDPLDLIDPVDILSKMPKDFYEKCEAKKWQERKEALEALEALTSANPKLEAGDYSDVVRTLKRMLGKDSNVIVVGLAAKCIAGLANGLKKKFSPYAPSCLETVMEKFKEKKATVVAPLRDAGDGCFNATTLETIQEDVIKVGLQNKNPSVKAETSSLLARGFARTAYSTMADKKIMKPYFLALIANLNESDPNVRECASEALGVALKHLGEKHLAILFQDIDPIKQGRIKECAEKAVITAPKSAAPKKAAEKPAEGAKKAIRGGGGKPPTGSAASSKSSESVEKADRAIDKRGPGLPKSIKTSSSAGSGVTKSGIAGVSNKGSEDKAKVTRGGAGTVKPRTSPNSKKALDDPIGSNLPVNTMKCQRIQDETKMKILRWNFTTPREEFIELLKELMTNAGVGNTLQSQMFSGDFKMHLKALETLTAELNNDIEGTLCNLDLILKWLTIRFFDTNPAVLSRSLDYLLNVFSGLADLSYSMADLEAQAFVPYLLLKIGEPKDNVRANVHQIIRSVVKVYSPQKVFTFLMEGLKSKNSRQRAECVDELGHLISTLGMSICQPSPSGALREIAKQISDRDNSVRNAALNAVVQAYFIEGDKVYKMIGHLSDKDQSLLDERIKRASKSRPPPQAHMNTMTRNVNSNNNNTANASHIPPMSTNPSPLNNNMMPGGAGGMSAAGSHQATNGSMMVPPPRTTPAQQPAVSVLQPTNMNTTVTLSPGKDFDISPREREVTKCPPEAASMQRAPVLPEKYRIDFDYYDNMFGSEDKAPIPELKLHDTNIDDILNEAPITLPKRHVSIPVRPMATADSSSKNAPVPSSAALSIDLVVSHVGSNELSRAMESVVQLEAMIAEPEVSMIMASRVDHLLSMLAMQMRHLQPVIGCSNDEETQDINKFLRCIVLLLMSLYKHDVLPKKATKTTLKELIYQLLILIVDHHLTRLADSATIMKSVNVLVVRIIEKSDPSAACSGLIRLLNDSLTLNQRQSMLDLVMKCLWKLLKQITTWMNNTDYTWNLVDIFTEFNAFMIAHPISSFKDKDTTSLKTIKTVIHSLVYGLGPSKITSTLAGMPEVRNSEAGAYLNKLVEREKNKLNDRKHRSPNAENNN